MSLFEAKEGTVNILETLFFGVGSCPRRRLQKEKNTNPFPQPSYLQVPEALCSQLNSTLDVGVLQGIQPPVLDQKVQGGTSEVAQWLNPAVGAGEIKW